MNQRFCYKSISFSANRRAAWQEDAFSLQICVLPTSVFRFCTAGPDYTNFFFMTRRVPHSRPGAVSFFAKTCSWRQTVVWRKTVGTKTAPGVLQRAMHATFLHCFGFWGRLSSCWHAARIHLASGLHVVVMQLPSSLRLARMRLAPRLHLVCIRLASSLHIGRI